MSPTGDSLARRVLGLRPPYQPPLMHWALAFTIGAALSLTGAGVWVVAVAATALVALAIASCARADAVLKRRRLQIALILL